MEVGRFMARTFKAIDDDLRTTIRNRTEVREKLRTACITKAERDTLLVRESVYSDRVEKLLDERSQVKFTQEINSLL
jgi:hypothetical protein